MKSSAWDNHLERTGSSVCRQNKGPAAPALFRIGLILMAAGRARRFGQNKLLRDFDGRPLVCRPLCLLQELKEAQGLLGGGREGRMILTEPHVVTCYGEVAELGQQAGLPVAVYQGGAQSDTIRTALAVPGADAWDGCMFLAADQPFLTVQSVRSLLEAFGDDPRYVFRLAWEEREGSPVLFPSAYFEELRALQGETGGSFLIRQDHLPVRLVRAGSECELLDADTEEEFVRLQRMNAGGIWRL